MATTTLSTAAIPAAMTFSSNKIQKRMINKVVCSMGGLSSYGGFKAKKAVVGLGFPVSTEQCSLRSGRKKGDFQCRNAAAEIFKIAAIMNGLTLVGVAVGFVLLRIEAAVEESE